MPKTKKQKAYTLELVINNDKYSVKTDDLKKSIMKLKPEQFFTEGYIKITDNKSEGVFERKLTLVQFKKAFNDSESLDLFLNNFYSLYGN